MSGVARPWTLTVADGSGQSDRIGLRARSLGHLLTSWFPKHISHPLCTSTSSSVKWLTKMVCPACSKAQGNARHTVGPLLLHAFCVDPLSRETPEPRR